MFHPDILIPATRARLPPALPSAARARRLTASRLLPLLRCRRRHRAWLTRGQRWRCARGKRSFSSTRSRWSTRRACCCPPPPPPRGAPSTHPSASSTCAAPACGSPPPPRWASCAPWLPSTRRAVGCLWVVCPGGGGGCRVGVPRWVLWHDQPHRLLRSGGQPQTGSGCPPCPRPAASGPLSGALGRRLCRQRAKSRECVVAGMPHSPLTNKRLFSLTAAAHLCAVSVVCPSIRLPAYARPRIPAAIASA